MKRYQIFVSSTFTDLQIERMAVLKSILSLNCFPAGMEMFPSASIEQFEYIKKVIDDSDYYILVIGGRYGDDSEGISYTEKKFDYAVSKNIPVLAFILEHPENIPAKFYELSESKREKLEDFKKKVMNGRLISFWNNPDELSSKVLFSLQNAMKSNPRRGWEKALPQGVDKVIEENIILKRQNNDLNSKIKKLEYENEFLHAKQDEAFGAIVTLSGSFQNDNAYRGQYCQSMTLNKIFMLWYASILEVQFDIHAKRSLENSLENHFGLNKIIIDEENYAFIKNLLSGIGVIAEFSNKKAYGSSKCVVVTDYGKRVWELLR